nr:J domain-containing protein [Mucilaginibacter sp. L294]
MKFFEKCTTLDEVKSTYKKLAMQYHPDRGGDTATMQEINKEYAFISAKIASGASFTAEEREKQMNFSEAYRKVIEQIIYLPDILIEQVGFWIWVTGQTKPVKEELKKAGLFFASKKMAWYYRSEEYKVKRGGKKSLDEIRSKYGSEVINGNKRQAITN